MLTIAMVIVAIALMNYLIYFEVIIIAIINSSFIELHQTQLELLKELKRVCEEYNIDYYLSCGSCLGAVRDNGFIPWDHDVDVFIREKDIYILESLKNAFNSNYFLQCKSSDPGFDSIIYRLKKNGTTCITKDSIGLDCHQGVGIDIYPLYNYPSNAILGKLFILLSFVLRLLVANRPAYNHGKIVFYVTKALTKLRFKKFNDYLIYNLRGILSNVPKGAYVLTYYGLDISMTNAILYDSEWFDSSVKIKFEDDFFPVPINYDEYLKKKYGDYNVLPPESERNLEYDEFIVLDVAKDYKNYKEYYLSS